MRKRRSIGRRKQLLIAVIATATISAGVIPAYAAQVSVKPASVTPAPKLSKAAPAGTASSPSQILKLNNWYLGLPTGSGDAGSVKQPKLGNYTSKYFGLNKARNGVVFTAPVKGSTTANSKHTRSELRETSPSGKLPWGWSAGKGKHTLTTTASITHLPAANGVVSFAQIHGPGSTWYLILKATGTGNGMAKLTVKDKTGKADGKVLDSAYKLGTRFHLVISAINGTVTIKYNGVTKVTTKSTQNDAYFKLGAYNQSKGDYGQVVVYSASVTHS